MDIAAVYSIKGSFVAGSHADTTTVGMTRTGLVRSLAALVIWSDIELPRGRWKRWEHNTVIRRDTVSLLEP